MNMIKLGQRFRALMLLQRSQFIVHLASWGQALSDVKTAIELLVDVDGRNISLIAVAVVVL